MQDGGMNRGILMSTDSTFPDPTAPLAEMPTFWSSSQPLKFFHQLGATIPDFQDEKKSLARVLEQFRNLTQATKGMLVMPDLDQECYTIRAAFGLNLSDSALRILVWDPKRYPLLLSEARQGEPLLINHESLARHPEFTFERNLGFQSVCFQLLGVNQNRFMGAVFLGNRLKNLNFSNRDKSRLAQARHAAETELERVLFHHELRGVFVNMAKAFIAAIEAKDRYTRGHSERVTDYALKMAQVLGWGRELMDVLHIAAILHDLGKIGVPEAILGKPGQLDPDEFGIVKQHPEGGATIVNTIPQLHQAVSGIISHHERYDGKGYPYGLAGTEIPTWGRLIAVADSYDAMTSDRPYRKSFSHQEACEEIRRCRGRQFDPEMADAFLEGSERGILP